MSRVGKMPIVLPKGVKATLSGRDLTVEGPKGKLTIHLEEAVETKITDGKIECVLNGTPPNGGALHGLTRSLVANMVKGVHEGYKRELEINGVGYRANIKGKDLELLLGFSHPVVYTIPEGIQISVEKQTRLTITGADIRQVGQTAAELRGLRKPEPYKGKGIRYAGEVVRRKVGKAAATTTSQ
ncbi:MAG: 50S ribosomal protein L6 [Pseudomonadota bacterium]